MEEIKNVDEEIKLNASVRIFTKDRENYSLDLGLITQEEYQTLIDTVMATHNTLTQNKGLSFIIKGVLHIFNIDNVVCTQIQASTNKG